MASKMDFTNILLIMLPSVFVFRRSMCWSILWFAMWSSFRLFYRRSDTAAHLSINVWRTWYMRKRSTSTHSPMNTTSKTPSAPFLLFILMIGTKNTFADVKLGYYSHSLHLKSQDHPYKWCLHLSLCLIKFLFIKGDVHRAWTWGERQRP